VSAWRPSSPGPARDRAPGRARSPAGAGPDTLPKTLAALVNLPEPKPAAAGSRPRCRLGGRLHLDRPAAEPEGEQGPRPALDRDPLPKTLAKIHGEGFHLVTGQRPAAAPEGEQGPRPALDRDTLPKALAALVNRAAPGRLVLIPLHGTPGPRQSPRASKVPGRRWTGTPSRRPSRRWSTSRSPSPPWLVRGPGFGLAAVFPWTGQNPSRPVDPEPAPRKGLPPGDRPAASGRARGRARSPAGAGSGHPPEGPRGAGQPRGARPVDPGTAPRDTRPAARGRAPKRTRPALDLDPLPEPKPAAAGSRSRCRLGRASTW